MAPDKDNEVRHLSYEEILQRLMNQWDHPTSAHLHEPPPDPRPSPPTEAMRARYPTMFDPDVPTNEET